MATFNPKRLSAFISLYRPEILWRFLEIEIIFAFSLQIKIGLFLEIDSIDAYNNNNLPFLLIFLLYFWLISYWSFYPWRA